MWKCDICKKPKEVKREVLLDGGSSVIISCEHVATLEIKYRKDESE